MFKLFVIKLLKQLLTKLEPVEEKTKVASTPTPAFSPNERTEIVAAPPRAKTFIPVAAERGSARPLQGRERLREQLHLAHCCPSHGCSHSWGDQCPVVEHQETPYFTCAKCEAA